MSAGDLADNLFGDPVFGRQTVESIGDGAVILRSFVDDFDAIVESIERVEAGAPFRHMVVPGGGSMSVAITSCGQTGWITDRSGYRYANIDPVTNLPWPPMPRVLMELAARCAAKAGWPDFVPDTCLINRYEPGARMALHQDRNECHFDRPIISVSLGLPAVFLFGGMNRSDRANRHPLAHGDVVVWGGPTRLAFHGVATLKDGIHPIIGRRRINLTFRKAL